MTKRILIAGASGLIGSALKKALQETKTKEDVFYDVHTLVRQKPQNENEHFWDPEKDVLDSAVFNNVDAVISLNGASVGKLPWTKKYRQELYDSRIKGTRLIAKTIKGLKEDAPKQWISASAVGFYGSQPGETLTEQSMAGKTFLAKLCIEWEREALAVADVTRVALLRTAPVLHPEGVLKPMILLTRLGLSGPIASGKQKFPWISLNDEVRAIQFVLEHKLEGPINLTSPNIATSNDVGRDLAKHLGRPFIFSVPAFALNAVLGKDAAQSLLTSDANVQPARLLEAGFVFKDKTLSETIKNAIKR